MRPTWTPPPIPTPTQTPIDLSQLNWIERELYLTGELPLIPEWMPKGILEGPHEPGRISRQLEVKAPSVQTWCELLPSQRLKLMELVVWEGQDIYDWVYYVTKTSPAPYGGGVAVHWLDRCPPAGSY